MERLAALILVAVACAEEPTSTLLERLGSPDPAVRLAAMDEVRLQPEEVRLALARQVSEASPEAAMRLWRAIGADALKEPVLIEHALKRTGAGARADWVRAAKATGVERFLALSPPLPAEALVELLSLDTSLSPLDSRPERPALRAAPAGLGGALALSKHESHAVRAALAEWLSGISGAEARGCLESLCQDPSGTVRLSAIRALLPRIEMPRDLRSFLLSCLADPSPEVRSMVLARLRTVANAASDLAAMVRLWDTDGGVRRAAAQYLVVRQLPWSLPYVVRAMADMTPQEASDLEQGTLSSIPPRGAVELAERLEVVPRAALPAALKLLDGLARVADLPGPCWLPAGRHVMLPVTVSLAPDVTALRFLCSSPVRIRVEISADGTAFSDLGVFLLAQGERMVPIGVGWRAARLTVEPVQGWVIAEGAGMAAELLPAASCYPLSGPADPVAAWKEWAAEARTLLCGEGHAALEAVWKALSEGNRTSDYLAARIEDCLQAQPGHPIARLIAARQKMEASSMDRAAEMLEELLRDRPGYAPALAALARVREVQEAPTAARELLGRAIQADPAEVSYRRRRADLATEAQDHAAASEDLAVALSVTPEDHFLRFDYGYALFSLGRYEDGLSEFRRVVERDPGHLNARYNIACGLARLGRADEALTALLDAVRAGFREVDFARKDPDLESIRSDPRFEAALSGFSSLEELEQATK